MTTSRIRLLLSGTGRDPFLVSEYWPNSPQDRIFGILETETLCKKECKNNKKTDIFSTVDNGWGHGYYLVEALCFTKSSFSLLGMIIF
jgi:hypothetical protein